MIIQKNSLKLFLKLEVKDLSDDKFSDKDIILETKNLTKIYEKSNNKKVAACNNVNLKIYKGKTSTNGEKLEEQK